MALPPAKRFLVLSSDDEGGSVGFGKQVKRDAVKLRLPTRSRGQRELECREQDSRKPQSTIGKSRQKQTKRNKNINTFFTATGEGADKAKRSVSTAGNIDATQLDLKDAGDEDAIEDFSDTETSNGPKVTQDVDYRERSNGTLSFSAKGLGSPNGGSKIQMQSRINGQGGNAFKISGVDQRPWAERFAPSTLDELAVHKKKVSDVRNWLENVYSGKSSKRLLLLKGPAGAGKTATVKMLAQVMKLDISEWKNPIGTEYSSEGYTSISANFEDFFDRSGKFNGLSVDSVQKHGHPISSPEIDARKVILLEEFPCTFLSASSLPQSFRSSVLHYLAATMPSIGSFYNGDKPSPITPAIMIVTETRPTSTTASSDAFTIHRLLGPDILSHPAVSVIDFNPVAPTFIGKALDLVIRKEARRSGRRRVPGPSLLSKLAEYGDVRCAIGTLEFLCIRAHDHDDWGGRVAANVKTGAKARTIMTQMENKSLEIVTRRETSLGLFHAVGKVVYNKRDDFALLAAEAPTSLPPVQPPVHLKQHVRPRLPHTSVDKLMDETGTDANTFIAALHENYVLSCQGSTFVDSLDGCLHSLSDGDLLGSSWNRRNGLLNPNSYATTSESLRQDEIAFQIVVRGLLFALPDPVKRPSHPHGVPGRRSDKEDYHKMFYPASMRLSRQMEEMEQSISQWHKRLGTRTMYKQQSTGERNCFINTNEMNNQHVDIKEQVSILRSDEEPDEPFRSSLCFTKAELILEILPYVIKAGQGKSFSGQSRELENIIQFHGIARPGDEASDTEEPEHCVISAADSATLPVIQRVGNEAQKEIFKGVMPIEQETEKLYLSDDDIEDL